VTSHQGQLQTLINEIEALLGKATPRLPWMVAGEANQQRRVLEQARNYLQTLQGQTDAPGGWGPVAPETGEIAPAGDAAQPTEASSQQVLQALLQEMQYLRSQTLQPLRSEVSLLQQQREQLQREVHQLELERLQIANSRAPQPALNPALVDEVVRRLQESLLSQLNPQIQALQAQVNDPAALYGQIESDLADPNALPQLHPSQRLEQLRRIQSQTDYMLLKLDTNLRAVFESMEQSIQSYRDSLHQGLDTMHGAGSAGGGDFQSPDQSPRAATRPKSLFGSPSQ
jgi:chromosome segregation ATPase